MANIELVGPFQRVFKMLGQWGTVLMPRVWINLVLVMSLVDIDPPILVDCPTR